ncbi:hypothetical protein VTL71DRAFT_630 [Oculimacula yallundae]|uniref:ferric-chelate reductase (NADPH) n=1 Tax=Oculimacula yallundae TaxID=86028 RepID=A0ABR4D0M0_9HELO
MAEQIPAIMSYIQRRMDGMHMGNTLFRHLDSKLARTYWYLVAGILGFIVLLRAIDYYQTWSRLRICRTRKSTKYPTRVNNLPMQIYATATAIMRESSYPQLHFTNKWVSWLSPPPLGRSLMLFCYWAVVAYMMTYKAIVDDANYYERIGFRNGWIGVTQVPMVYLLATKSSIIGQIIGSSHEVSIGKANFSLYAMSPDVFEAFFANFYQRINWAHRWVSRTLLFTATVHGGFFMYQWVRADFLAIELEMMPMVKYGIGAWFVLVWTFLSSLSPLRRVAYEFFVLQHIAAAGVFLWLLHVHVPAYAQYNIWFAIGAIASDWVLRGLLMIWKNLRLQSKKARNGTQRIGHEIEVEAISNDLTIVTIKDVHLTWMPGQHIYLWLPYLGPLESHPFTISSPYTTKAECHCNEIQLAIRAHYGFSRRIHNYAKKTQGAANSSLTGIVMGPYGAPPRWEAFETLILISASTGASYTLPILESLLACPTTICTQRIFFLLVVRDRPHCQYYEERLSKALGQAEARDIDLDIQIAITGSSSDLAESGNESDKSAKISSTRSDEKRHSRDNEIKTISEKKNGSYILVKTESFPSKPSSSSSQPHTTESKSCCSCGQDIGPCCCAGRSTTPPLKKILYSYTRPNLADFIRRPVEITGGETSVAVCGGKELVAATRNSVARLSDERAVHKGTGAQGIHLHVEEYCF